jgi:Flp pilus assembly protein TadG
MIRRRSGGQAVVELAIAIPVLLLVLLAIVEAAGYAFAQGALQNAAQEGGRTAALPGTSTESAVRDRVVQQAVPLEVQAADVAVAVNSGSTTFLLRQSGDRVRVSVAYDYHPFTSVLLGGASFELSAAAEYMVE